MKKTLAIHTVIYFLLYTVSLAAACFEAGLAYPATDGIGMIWLFSLVYQVLFLRSLRSAFQGTMTPAACLGRGIFTLGFIVIFWGISLLLRMGGAPYQPREIIYPAVLFIGSAAVFALSLGESVKARKSKKCDRILSFTTIEHDSTHFMVGAVFLGLVNDLKKVFQIRVYRSERTEQNWVG